MARRKAKDSYRLFVDISPDTVVNVRIGRQEAEQLSGDLTAEFGEPKILADEHRGNTFVHYYWQTPIGEVRLLHDTGVR